MALAKPPLLNRAGVLTSSDGRKAAPLRCPVIAAPNHFKPLTTFKNFGATSSKSRPDLLLPCLNQGPRCRSSFEQHVSRYTVFSTVTVEPRLSKEVPETRLRVCLIVSLLER